MVCAETIGTCAGSKSSSGTLGKEEACLIIEREEGFSEAFKEPSPKALG